MYAIRSYYAHLELRVGRIGQCSGSLATEQPADLSEAVLLRRNLRIDRITSYNVCYTKLLREPQGSFEITCAKWDLDIACYYNLWTSSYMRDRHLDRAYLDTQLRLRPFILQALENFSDLFRRLDSALRERGDYFRANTGRFYFGLTNIDFEMEVGTNRSDEEVLRKTEQIFNGVRRITSYNVCYTKLLRLELARARSQCRVCRVSNLRDDRRASRGRQVAAPARSRGRNPRGRFWRAHPSYNFV